MMARTPSLGVSGDLPKPGELLLLLLIVAAQCGLNLRWLALDQPHPTGDPAAHLSFALDFQSTWMAGSPEFHHPYPPLAHGVGALLWWAVGGGYETAIASLSVFVLLFVAGVWWLGREAGGPVGGIAAALAAAGCPLVAVHARTYYIDLPCAAMVSVAVAALVASRGFRQPIATGLFGLFTGLAMLTRWSSLFFLLLPAVLAALPILRDRRGRGALAVALWALAFTAFQFADALAGLQLWARPDASPSRTLEIWSAPPPDQPEFHLVLTLTWLVVLLVAWRSRAAAGGRWNPGAGAAIAVSLAALVCLWWYTLSLPAMYWKMAHQAEERAAEPLLFRQNLRDHLNTLSACFWGTALWLSGAALAALRWPALRRPFLVSLACLAATLLFVSATSIATPRYMLPGLVFLLPVLFGWVGRLPRIGVALAGAVAVLGLAQVGPWPGPGKLTVTHIRPPEEVALLDLPIADPPRDWRSREEEVVAELLARRAGTLAVVMGPEAPFTHTLTLLADLHGSTLPRVEFRVGEADASEALRLPHLLVATRDWRSEAEVLRELPWLGKSRFLGRWTVRPGLYYYLYENEVTEPGGSTLSLR